MITIENNTTPTMETVNPILFPDGTKLLKFDARYGGDFTINWLYDRDEELFQLIALTKHIKNQGGKVWLNMPYVPNARMDRVKTPDEVFTLKAFADTINWLGFEEVRISNPHSTVSEALFDRVYVDFNCVYEDVKKIVETSLSKIDVLYFPDEGACKRYSDLLAPLGLPVAFGIKKRDWKTGEIKGIEIAGYDELKGKNILMVDDICAYGGTFYYSALRLKELGANDISCYVTHLEDSVMDVQKGKLINAKWYAHDGKSSTDLIKTIYATNSIFRGVASHKIKIIREF
jgi:ribose-phosphate pyrophosphokinase